MPNVLSCLIGLVPPFGRPLDSNSHISVNHKRNKLDLLGPYSSVVTLLIVSMASDWVRKFVIDPKGGP